MSNVAANLCAIREELKGALHEAGRSPDATSITAVSKTVERPSILAALEAGQRVFGENRVQEAQKKWPILREEFRNVELRLIGPLQSNKVKEAVSLFDVIETVDRPKIAKAISMEMARQHRQLKLLAQINTGEESQKAGVVPQDADAFINLCRDEYGLGFEGLMCIPPAHEDPAPHFALLAKIARRNGVTALSMGMSNDFAIAAQLGATHVRIGSAIFGKRA